MEPAGPEKAVGIISSAYLKDPTDPQWQNTPEYKDWLAWMKKYNSSASPADVFNVYGYTVAQTMVAVLKQCGNDLTRENLMKQAANIHDLKLPMLLPGVTVSTSANDFAPIKQLQLEKFDGKTWKLFGDVISASSS
jgi:branched-chain amino acid transport system substrate-binding protein